MELPDEQPIVLSKPITLANSPQELKWVKIFVSSEAMFRP